MKKFCFFFISLSIVLQTHAQQLTKQDYERAVSFLTSNLFNKKVFNFNTQFSWFADSTGLSFISQSKEGKVFNKIELKKLKIEPLFNHERLAKALTDGLKKEIKPTDLPVTSVKYINKTHIEFTTGNSDYVLDLNTYSLSLKNKEENKDTAEKSPDGKWIAYSQGYNLFIKSTNSGQVKQLSTAGIKNYEYASYYGWGDIMEGENGERPAHFGVNWSPDSKWIQTYICDLRNGKKMYLLDWSVDTLYKAKLLSYYRGSPGDTDMVYMLPVFFNVETGEETRKDEFRNVNATSIEWSKEPGIAYIENHVRGYQEIDLYKYNCNNTNVSSLLEDFQLIII